MFHALYTAASGMTAQQINLDNIANNLANSATSGYKNDREYYGVYSSDDSENSVDGGVGASLPVVERQWTDFSPGVIENTGNPLDVVSTRSNSAQRVVALNRALHTGAIGGGAGRLLAALASLTLPLQAITGACLWWAKRRSRSTSRTE